MAKANLLQQIEALDHEADGAGLDEDGWALRYFLEDHLTNLAVAEEEY
jgi:hypothetical protein